MPTKRALAVLLCIKFGGYAWRGCSSFTVQTFAKPFLPTLSSGKPSAAGRAASSGVSWQSITHSELDLASAIKGDSIIFVSSM